MKSYVVYASIYVSGPKHCTFPAIDEMFPSVCIDLFFLSFFVFCCIPPCILSSTGYRIPTFCVMPRVVLFVS